MAQAGWRIDGTLADPLPINSDFDAPELSDLAFDSASGHFLAVSDKLKSIFTLTLNETALPTVVTIVAEQPLKSTTGLPFTGRSDFEGIGILPDGRRLLTNEYDQSVRVFSTDGRQLRQLRSVSRQGLHRFARPHSNKGLEGITVDNNGNAWLINEGPLKPDGDTRHSRLLVLTKQLLAGPQWAYPLDPDNGLFGSYGISAIEALPDGQLLVLERKVRFDLRYAGPALSHEIYLISPNSTTADDTTGNQTTAVKGYDVSSIDSLATAEFTPLTKTLLWQGSFARLNFEGMAMGAKRENDSYPLLLIADDGQGLKAAALLLELTQHP